jgi:Zn-dependent peptidase ImmA (M78 family)/transcriptional regulator with XRE-family HTH domain
MNPEIEERDVFQARLRQMRLARGLSLAALSALMGGAVTKQALSKYEQGRALPTSRVLTALARALEVKSMELLRAPTVAVEVLAFRRGVALRKRAEQQLVNLVTQKLEERVRLHDLAGTPDGADIPVRSLRVAAVEDSERAASALRDRWSLGTEPLASVTDVLEGHCVHVIEVPADDGFDGLAAVARVPDGAVAGAAVVSRSNVAGERQRFNLAHELGHLVLHPSRGVDEEKAAFRFAGAFLAPAESLRRDVGARRTSLGAAELLLLKQRYGMSMQALIYRLSDLGIISMAHATQWWQTFRARDWKRREPGELEAERPQWARRTVLRALAEGLMSSSEAASFLGESLGDEVAESLSQKRAFLKLPLGERRRILEQQAGALSAHYEDDPEWRELAVAELTRE